MLIAVSAVFAISCKKEKSSSNKLSAVGYWRGLYSSTSSAAPNTPFALFLFRNDGTMREFYDSWGDTTGTNKTGSTYTYVDDSTITWTSTYPGPFTYSYLLHIRENSTRLVGTWGNGTNTSGGGQIDVHTGPWPVAIGYFKGQYSYSATPPPPPPNQNYLWLLFYGNGTLRQYYDATDTTGSNKESGTWNYVNDSIISWHNNFGEYYYGAIRSNSSNISGAWGYALGTYDKGQFNVTRQ